MVDINQVALKQKGIDKLLDDAREDNKENDMRLNNPNNKSKSAPLTPRVYRLVPC